MNPSKPQSGSQPQSEPYLESERQSEHELDLACRNREARLEFDKLDATEILLSLGQQYILPIPVFHDKQFKTHSDVVNYGNKFCAGLAEHPVFVGYGIACHVTYWQDNVVTKAVIGCHPFGGIRGLPVATARTVSTEGSKRKRQKRACGCPFKLMATFNVQQKAFEITTLVGYHNHPAAETVDVVPKVRKPPFNSFTAGQQLLVWQAKASKALAVLVQSGYTTVKLADVQYWKRKCKLLAPRFLLDALESAKKEAGVRIRHGKLVPICCYDQRFIVFFTNCRACGYHSQCIYDAVSKLLCRASKAMQIAQICKILQEDPKELSLGYRRSDGQRFPE